MCVSRLKNAWRAPDHNNPLTKGGCNGCCGAATKAMRLVHYAYLTAGPQTSAMRAKLNKVVWCLVVG